MQYAYGGIFLISLLLLPIYFLFIRKKHDETWMLVFCICVSIVNLGYTLIALSKTVEFALFANKVTYFGQVLLPLCMFMMITKRCGYHIKKWVTVTLISVAALMYAVILTTGHLDWYYTSATIENVAGATILKKEYGVLHPTNLIYVLAYFIAMVTVLCVSFKKKRNASQAHAVGMLIIVLGNIGMWLIQKVVPWEFELLSITYLMSAGGFFAVWMVLSDYVHKDDIQKYSPAKAEELAVRITTMTMEEKLFKVLSFVKEDNPLSIREREILEMIIVGKKRRDIADTIHLSENTVKTYTRSLYGKLAIGCREELYELLLKEG